MSESGEFCVSARNPRSLTPYGERGHAGARRGEPRAPATGREPGRRRGHTAELRSDRLRLAGFTGGVELGHPLAWHERGPVTASTEKLGDGDQPDR